MSSRNLLGALALAGLGLGVVIGGVSLLEPPPLGAEEIVIGTRLFPLPDGGKGYAVTVIVDGGIELRRVAGSNFVRAPMGQTDGGCLIREPLPGVGGGFKTPRFFGEGNRFPRAWAVGPGCEEVAQFADDVRDSEKSEDELVQKMLDAGEGKP